MTYFREMRVDDILSVLSMRLRKADEEECWASTGLPPVEALSNSLEVSTETYVVVHNDRIEAVFGVSSAPPWDFALPWFVATDKFDKFKISFAKESKKVIEAMLDQYGFLFNLVDSRHEKAIRWLEWIGFTIDRNSPLYLADPEVPFYLFWKRKEDGHVRTGNPNDHVADCECNSGGSANLCRHSVSEPAGILRRGCSYPCG